MWTLTDERRTSLDIRETVRQQERAFKEQKALALRRRRIELGLTIAQVAEPAGVSVAQLSSLELGGSASRKMYARIEAALAEMEKEHERV
jgi:predicted transcriptional regulator